MSAADDAASDDSAPRPDWYLFVALVGIGLLAGALVLVLTRHNLGLAPPDSAVYLATADNLRAGHGYSTPFDTLFDSVAPVAAARGDVPLVHWLPGYPTLLAAGSVLFGTSMRAARFVNAGLFALSVVLGGLIVFQIRRSRLRAVAASVVLALLPAMISVHGIVFADAMLLAAALATVLALHHLVERPTPWRYALVAALGVVAVSARYPGVAVAAAAGTTLAVVMPGSIARRLLRGAIVAAPGAVFGAFWLLRGDARGLVSHLPGSVDLSTIAGTFGGWFGTGQATALRHVALAAALVLLAAAIWTAFGRGLPPSRRALTVGLGLTGFFVFLTVLFSRSFVDALVNFGYRHLLPVQIAVVLLVAAFRLPVTSGRWLRIGVYGAILVAALVAIWPWSARGAWRFAVPGRLTTIGAVRDGFPFPPEDPAARVVSSLPEGSAIASDFPENVWLRTDRPVIQIPSRWDITADRANPDFDEEMRELERVMGNGGYVVLYGCHARKRPLPGSVPDSDRARTAPAPGADPRRPGLVRLPGRMSVVTPV